MKKVLFVCLGNICRSPTAEGVMKKLIRNENLENNFEVDSAGIIGLHAGEEADLRSQEHARARGIKLTSIARQFNANDDFHHFDYVMAMDKKNFQDLKNLDKNGEFKNKIFMITDFCQKIKVDEVPDPYYLGPSGFERVLDILEDACSNLLREIYQKT